MIDPENPKDYRRQKFLGEKPKKNKISEEEKHISRASKELKKKKQHLEEEELWDDWEKDK